LRKERVVKYKEQLSAIKRISLALSQTLKLDELLPKIMAEMADIMNAERSTLYLVDEKNEEIWSKVAIKSEIKEIRQKFGNGLSGWVARHGKKINLEDVYTDDRFDPKTDKKTGFRTRSALTIPLLEITGKRKKKVIGVIQVLNKKTSKFFDHDDETLLESMSYQISISIQNSRLYWELQDKVDEIDFLYEIEKKVTKTENLDDLLTNLTENIVDYLDAEAGSIIIKDKTQNDLFFKVATGKHANHLKKIRLEQDHGIVGWVVSNNESALVKDVEADGRFNSMVSKSLRMQTNSILCTPIVSKENNETIGAIELINRKGSGRYFSENDLRVIELIAGHISRIIETLNYRDEKLKQDQLVSIGRFLSTIVHDIRSPMNNIMGFVELMREDDASSDERNEYSSIIAKQINSLIAMTTEILDFAKGKTSVLPRKIGVSDIFNDYVNFVKDDLKKQRVEFVIKNNASSHIIYADPLKLNRVFMNLHKNAIEAMNGTERKIEFSVSALQKNWICFKIKDSGCGIPDKVKNKIFDSFISHGKENGTGLGLAIVKKIIDDHHGKIELKSSKKGTEFKIYLKEFSPS
jgi:signal transduction histidine kinase